MFLFVGSEAIIFLYVIDSDTTVVWEKVDIYLLEGKNGKLDNVELK